MVNDVPCLYPKIFDMLDGAVCSLFWDQSVVIILPKHAFISKT